MMNPKFFILLITIWLTTFTTSFGQINVISLQTKVNSGFRGLFAVDESTCWVSGTEGSVLVTSDGGHTWNDVSPEGYEDLQFRDIHAFDETTALILSAGLPAVICKTTDGGSTWDEVYHNEAKGVFFDAMDFWDHRKGMAFSDAQDNKLLIIKTENGGESWSQIPYENLPAVHLKQGGFAASGTCLESFGQSSALIGLGGAAATILRTENFGKTWTKTFAPIDSGKPSTGIFSINMLNNKTGIAVGGDYIADSLSHRNMALTNDGGRSWKTVKSIGLANKYLSAVSYYNAKTIVATSRTGIRYSNDGGKSWKSLSRGYYSIQCIPGKNICWCSGSNGSVAKLELP